MIVDKRAIYNAVQLAVDELLSEGAGSESEALGLIQAEVLRRLTGGDDVI